MESTNNAKASIVGEQDDPYCPLLELPPELRLRIYDHIYNTQYRCTLQQETQTRCHQIGHCAGAANLLSTCKEIYAEVLPILYSTTTFKVIIFGGRRPSGGPQYEDFLKPRDSRHCLKHARNLELVILIMRNTDILKALEKIMAVCQQVPQDRRLNSCTVRCEFCVSDPVSKEVEMAQKTLAAAEKLTQRRGLSAAESDIYSRLQADVSAKVRKYTSAG
jgi:hypothetical protein